MHPARSGDRNVVGGDRHLPDRGLGYLRRGDRYTLDRWLGPQGQGSGGGAPPNLATGYSLSGPSSGNVSVASGAFTVALIPSGGSVTGPVTITPSDLVAGGVFTPATVDLTTAAPSATFTYTPGISGTRTISCTNNKGLTDPGNLSYAASSAFDPTTIAGLKLWLKADALALSDGAAVATWNDSSGNSHNAAQATPANQPVFKTNILNSKPVVRFTAANNNYLDVSGALSGAQPWTVFAVLKPVAAVPMIAITDNATGQNTVGVNSSSVLIFHDGFSTTYAGSNVLSGFHVLTAISKVPGGDLAYIDGVAETLSVVSAVSGAGHFNQIGVFPAVGFCSGDLAELLIYDSGLSTTDRQNVEAYLKTKYALTAPPFDPTTIAGLKLWLKADALALSDGTAVATWPDSSSGNNMNQAGPGNRPVYKTNIVNGKPVVRFDAVDDYLALSSEINFTAYSAFVVYKTSGDSIILGGITGAHQQFRVGDAGNNRYSCFFGGSSSAFSNTLTAARTTWNLGSILGVPGGVTSFYEAGVFLNTGSADGVFTLFGSIGLAFAPTAAPVNGDIAEILIYNSALSAADRHNVESYLGAKYGIAVTPGRDVTARDVVKLVGKILVTGELPPPET